jgi:hypothetical protein
MLHLRGARCGRSAATSAAPSTALPWAAYAREAPSAPDETPPLTIYMHFLCPLPFLAPIFMHTHRSPTGRHPVCRVAKRLAICRTVVALGSMPR